MFEKVHAAAKPLGSTLTGEGLGPFAKIVSSGGEGLKSLTNIISAIIGVMTVAAGIWFLFNFIIGGIQWISGGGDKHALESAQQRITNAFIGLVIVIAGFTILSLASVFLGYDFLITNPDNVMKSLFPGGPAQ